MMIKAFDAQGGHIYLGLLVSGQLRDDFACDGRQRNALHAVAGGNDDVVIAAGASDIGQTIRRAGAQPAPDLN